MRKTRYLTAISVGTSLLAAQAAYAGLPSIGASIQAAASGWAIGTTVEALYFGKFKRGVIVNVRVLPASGQKKYKVRWEDGSGEYEVVEQQMRLPAVVNFSGANFKVGEYVHVWYSNGWLETQILDVKDGKIKVVYGGEGEKWFAFDDRTIRSKVREEQEAKAKGAEEAFIKDVADPYFGYAHAILWAMGDARFDKETPLSFVSQYGRKPEENLEYLSNMAAGLNAMAKVMQEKYADAKDIDVANHPQMKAWSIKYKELKYAASFYRLAASKTKEGLPKFLQKMNQEAIDKKFNELKAIGEVTEHRGGGKGIHYRAAAAAPTQPGDANFQAGTKDIVQDGGKQFTAALANYLLPLYKAAGLGEADIAPVLAGAAKAVAEAKAEFDKNLPVMTVSFPSKDAQLEQFAKGYIAKQIPGATVIKAGAFDSGWKIWANNVGIPESRTKWGGVHFKDPASGLCGFSPIQLGQNYAGGGKYSNDSYFSGLGGAYFYYSVGKCK